MSLLLPSGSVPEAELPPWKTPCEWRLQGALCICCHGEALCGGRQLETYERAGLVSGVVSVEDHSGIEGSLRSLHRGDGPHRGLVYGRT